jgi:WD40 repeat protein
MRDIAPVLREKCLTCHGPEKAKGNYRLDTFELLNKPGSSKSAPITPGDARQSHLYELLTATDEDDRMPQKDEPLPKAQIAIIERWIREGATFDGPDPKASLASLAGFIEQPEAPNTYASPVPITALAFHPAGDQIAVGGYHEVTIWEPADGRLRRRVGNVAQRTFALAFSQDGAVLATASGTPGKMGETKLFESESGKLLQTLATTPDVMLAVCFNADSTRVACAGSDNTIRVFDMANGRDAAPSASAELTIEQHADWIMSLAFSPDGSNIVSASRDKTVRVFDAKTGELEVTYLGHSEAVFATVFSPDGKRVFSAGRDRKVHIWETKDAKKVGEISGFDAEITRLLPSRLGLLAATGKEVRLYGFEGNRELARKFSGHTDVIHSLAISEKAGWLASGSHDGEIRIWKLDTGQLVHRFKAAPTQVSAR